MPYMFRSLGFPVKGPTDMCGDNLGMIISRTNPYSELKNKHVAISYHKLRNSPVVGIVKPIKVCTTVNQSEIITKSMSVGNLGIFTNESYIINCGEA